MSVELNTCAPLLTYQTNVFWDTFLKVLQSAETMKQH